MQDGYLNHSCFLFAWPDAHFCSPSKPEALISIVFLRYQLSVPSNWVHVQFFDKHREHYKLEFGNLPQNCHIAIQYLIIFSAMTSSSGVELKLSKFLKNLPFGRIPKLSKLCDTHDCCISFATQ